MVDIDPQFRSTGSYEPDPDVDLLLNHDTTSFDPQALTSLTPILPSLCEIKDYSFDPQALTSLTPPRS